MSDAADQQLTPDRLRRMATVLEVALELEVEERRAYFAALDQVDADLVARLEQIVASLEHPSQLETSDASNAKSKAGTFDAETLGPYRIVYFLGVGGMGTVYLAERDDDEFERRVAIKVLRLGFDMPEARQRFLSERQILAGFEHPNIARMYEGGTTGDGRPYLVMEYVEGLPIDRYCDQHGLGIAARIELFRQVCSAVQYAHRNLVVHRDLKPSNVLVGDDGVPKLLDFGIAKLLDPAEFPLPVEPTRTGPGR